MNRILLAAVAVILGTSLAPKRSFADANDDLWEAQGVGGLVETGGGVGGAFATGIYADKFRDAAWDQALAPEAQALQAAQARAEAAEAAMKKVSPDYLSTREDYFKARDGYSYDTTHVQPGFGMMADGKMGMVVTTQTETVNVPPDPTKAASLLKDLQAMEKRLPPDLVNNFHSSGEAFEAAERNFKAAKATFFAARGATAEAAALRSTLRKISLREKLGYVGVALLAVDGLGRIADSMGMFDDSDYNPNVDGDDTTKPMISPLATVTDSGVHSLIDAFGPSSSTGSQAQ